MIYAFINQTKPYIASPEFAEEVAKKFPVELLANAGEECAEVTQCICKLIREKKAERSELILEMADVLIMFQYLIAQQNITDEELIDALVLKLKRAAERYEKTGNPFLTSSQIKEFEDEAKKAKKKAEKKEKKASEGKPEKKKSDKPKEKKTDKEKKEKKSTTKKKDKMGEK